MGGLKIVEMSIVESGVDRFFNNPVVRARIVQSVGKRRLGIDYLDYILERNKVMFA